MPERSEPAAAPKPPDLSRRYHMQLHYPNLDDDGFWDTYKSFDTPPEALEGCSEILETVKILMGITGDEELKEDFLRIRVWDTREDRPILWEDENGAVHGDPDDFRISDPCQTV